ncbi:hypothetical protein DFH28DRAFT_468881 [Melampsora americana]|nr:hypothetical protein DFH28DRAFT_468881 [Melampsora americana]
MCDQLEICARWVVIFRPKLTNFLWPIKPVPSTNPTYLPSQTHSEKTHTIISFYKFKNTFIYPSTHLHSSSSTCKSQRSSSPYLQPLWLSRAERRVSLRLVTTIVLQNHVDQGLHIAVNRLEVSISNECSPRLNRIVSNWTQRLDQEGHNSVGSVLASDSKLLYQLFSLHLIWIPFLEKCSSLLLMVLLSQKKDNLEKVVKK